MNMYEVHGEEALDFFTKYSKHTLHLITFIYLFSVCEDVKRSEENVQNLILSFLLGPGNRPQVARLGEKCTKLNHPPGPHMLF